MIKKYKEKILHHLEEVWKIKTSPKSLAFGFALGTFLAMMPFSVFGMAIGLGLLIIFKKLSKITLLLAFLIFNPLIELSLQFLSYWIGIHILAGREIQPFTIELYNTLAIYTQRLLIGSFILATTLAIIGYITFYYIAKNIQEKKQKTLLENKEINPLVT